MIDIMTSSGEEHGSRQDRLTVMSDCNVRRVLNHTAKRVARKGSLHERARPKGGGQHNRKERTNRHVGEEASGVVTPTQTASTTTRDINTLTTRHKRKLPGRQSPKTATRPCPCARQMVKVWPTCYRGKEAVEQVKPTRQQRDRDKQEKTKKRP